MATKKKVAKKVKANSPKREKLKLVNFKTSEKERAVLRRQARIYTKGIVSEYIRLVAVHPENVRLKRPAKGMKLAA